MHKFRCAFAGIGECFKDRSIVLQICLATGVIIAGWMLRLTYTEWLIVVLCIGLVIGLEIINSCIEKLCDLYVQKQDERIRVIKDMAAAAVLTACLISATIALMIVLHHIK